MAKDKQHLILSLTPSGTEEEKSYKSLSSTPCGSLHSVRSRSQANLANAGTAGSSESNQSRGARFKKQSPSMSPRHRKKASSTERVLSPTNHNAIHIVEASPAVIDDRLHQSGSSGGFASQIDALSLLPNKMSPRHLAFQASHRHSPMTNETAQGAYSAKTSKLHKPLAPPPPARMSNENRTPQTPSKFPREAGTTNLTYQSLTSHPNYGNSFVPNSFDSSFHSNNSWYHSDDEDEDDDVHETLDELNQSPRHKSEHGRALLTNGHGPSIASNWPNKTNLPTNQNNLPPTEHFILSTSEVATTESGQHQIFAPYHILSSNPPNNDPVCSSSRPVPRHSSLNTAVPGNGIHPIAANLETSKSELNQRISVLFGKIGSSAFELLDEHKESLGDCVNNEYTLASLFEHKSGSLFFYGMVDTIFWNSHSKTMSLVEFQTTVKATPSPYHLLQLYCFKEIADKKKICKRIKLYVLGLHLESDGPRLKLWRYKATGAMPSLKALLFDSKLQTQERLYSCPEFNFMGRLKQGKEVVYEMVWTNFSSNKSEFSLPAFLHSVCDIYNFRIDDVW